MSTVAGRTEFLRALVGLSTVESGTVSLNGETYTPSRPAAAASRGLVYVTEERKTDGIVAQMSGLDNVALPVLKRYTRFGWLRRGAMDEAALEILGKLQIRGDVTSPVESLSGGNQQKVLLARAIAQRPTVLLLDEPTKGVDIGVKNQIHDLLKHMAEEQGLTLIVASSEEEEILNLADRVVVFAKGSAITESISTGALDVARLRELAWS